MMRISMPSPQLCLCNADLVGDIDGSSCALLSTPPWHVLSLDGERVELEKDEQDLTPGLVAW